MSKKSIYKPRPVSGFPEFLPEIRRIEQQWLDIIREKFELYGYCSIETPSIEELAVIEAKSDGGDDADKEIYVLERLHKEDGDKEARLALHFDQTVPLARYTAQHFNDLVFPFKRYQMQRVWRGERPQAGRFREFRQCDIDVINVDHLPLHFDAEMPAIIWETLSSLPGMDGEKFQIQISNRKILIGLLEGLGVENIPEITRWIDKLDKLPKDQIANELKNSGLSQNDIQKIWDTIEKSDQLQSITALNETMKEGIEELQFVMNGLSHLPEGAVVADLSIVRGLDYYTGTVYETRFTDDPDYGAICAGGRYNDLASHYINKKLPGVGISIGFSRLFDKLLKKQKFIDLKISPADVLITLPNEESRSSVSQLATQLRQRGIKVEQYHAPQKFGKQLSYAEKKGIPYVWFPDTNEVKNMKTGEQSKADTSTWKP